MAIDYIVVGSSGEYSDQSHLIVASYSTKEQAELHVKMANDYVKSNTVPRADMAAYMENRDKDPELANLAYHQQARAHVAYYPTNPYDVSGRCSEDTTYKVNEALSVRHVDEYLDLASTDLKLEGSIG